MRRRRRGSRKRLPSTTTPALPLTVTLRPTRLLAAGLPVACLVAFGAGAPVAGETILVRATDVASVTTSDWASVLGLSWPQNPDSANPPFDYVSVASAVPAPVLPSATYSPGTGWWYPPGGTGAPGTAGTVRLANGIPARAFQAYVSAASRMSVLDSTCRLPWWMLAGIGRVESNHGRYGGAVVTASGRVVPSILGIRLDGSRAGTATITDSDNGRYDGDTAYDRAVGPMQFLPGTWAAYGADGNGDGVADPQNIDDAALAAGRYLCQGSADLSTDAGQVSAVLRYNRSMSYVRLVLSIGKGYATGLPIDPTPAPADPGTPSTPPRPTPSPTVSPTPSPTVTRTPTPTPTTSSPSPSPTTSSPTGSPTTSSPTGSPTTSGTPTDSPTGSGTGSPTGSATESPTTSSPTDSPTGSPSVTASASESAGETTAPSQTPSCPTPSDISGSPTTQPADDPAADPCSTAPQEPGAEGTAAALVSLNPTRIPA